MMTKTTKKFFLALLICSLASANIARAETYTSRQENSGTASYTDSTFANSGGYSVTPDDYSNNGGGAIYNTGTISSITATQYTTDSTTGALTESSSSFSGNSVTSTKSFSDCKHVYLGGGAIYNSGTIGTESDGTVTGGISYTVFTGNTASGIGHGESMGGEYRVVGGAVWNDSTGEIGTISNSLFTNNTATANPNYTSSSNTYAEGGAICNEGAIGSIIDTTFTSNKCEIVSGRANALGGAICNTGTIGSIANATFTLNTASCVYSGSYAYAGAIYNLGTISSITNSTFSNNTATNSASSSHSYGGAISNGSTIEEISGCTFSNNSAGNGGAIYNTSTITTIKNTSFTGNTATTNGGAIYTSTDLTIAADGSATDGSGDVVFSGNKAGGSGDAIYVSNASRTVKFELSNGGSIKMGDSIDGASGYSVKISGDNSATTFYLLNDINNAALSVGDSNGKLTLDTIDSTIKTYSLNTFTVAGNFNMAVDVDLANEKMDRISATDYGTSNGTLNVSSMNVFGDTSKDYVAIYFAESGLMMSVESSLSKVTAYTPVERYDYKVYYVYKEDGTVTYGNQTFDADAGTEITSESENGGYFVFGEKTTGTGGDLEDYNPAVLAPEVAAAGVYGAMNMVLDYGFEHSDYFMKLPEAVRLAQIDQVKAEKSASKVKENDPRRSAYYNQHELTYRGAWFKSFYSNDRVSFQDGFTSRDKYWGGMLGFDSNLKEHGDGWAHLFTGYVGTMGIRQEYSGGHIKQHGGFVGATASFYKKNFFTAWTIAAGTMKAHEHTMYGKDKERLDSYGVAARFGWNIDMDYNGKFALLPTFTASYSTVNPEDFTNSADVKFSGSGFRAVQLNPNVKFIWKMNDGWQPYLTVGEIWTVGESSHVTATYSGTRNNLTALDLRAYTEYGLGVQKRWADQSDAYVQFLGHSHGRDGFLVNAGIRWNF